MGDHPELDRDVDDYVKVSDIAADAEVSHRTILNWITSGMMPARRKSPRGPYFVRWGDYVDYVRSNELSMSAAIDGRVSKNTLTSSERSKELAKGRRLKSPQVAAKQRNAK